jgi:hypothetical protein
MSGVAASVSTVDARRRLAERLAAEDAAESRGLSPFERTTCGVHRRWIHDCVSSPLHVVAVAGYRWCRRCAAVATVGVDHLAGTVTVRCTRCERPPDTPATAQIIRVCRASLAAAHDDPVAARHGYVAVA